MPKAKAPEKVRQFEGDIEDVIERLIVATIPEDRRDRFVTYVDPTDDTDEFATVADAEAWATYADDVDELQDALGTEVDGRNRKGVVNAIRARLAELEEE